MLNERLGVVHRRRVNGAVARHIIGSPCVEDLASWNVDSMNQTQMQGEPHGRPEIRARIFSDTEHVGCVWLTT